MHIFKYTPFILQCLDSQSLSFSFSRCKDDLSLKHLRKIEILETILRVMEKGSVSSLSSESV